MDLQVSLKQLAARRSPEDKLEPQRLSERAQDTINEMLENGTLEKPAEFFQDETEQHKVAKAMKDNVRHSPLLDILYNSVPRHQLAMASSLPSRYAIEDVIWFHPSVNQMTLEEAQQHAIKAQIVGVSFEPAKVMYDLALFIPEDGDYYTAQPLCCVDSFFVRSGADMESGPKSMEEDEAQYLSSKELRSASVYFQAVASAVKEHKS